MKIFGFQIDVARQIERPEVLHEAVETLAACGHNVCMLYLEDAYQYPRHPGIARRHAYSVECMQQLHSRCARHGMELIPVIPALGHGSYITAKPGYAKYDEGRDSGAVCGSVCPSFPETYTLLRELFEDWCRHVPGRYIHAGLDESAAMGRHHVQAHGREGFDPADMFAAHANKLAQIARDLGRRLIIWGDMLYYLPAAIGKLDKDIIIADWYYYVFPDVPRVEAFNFADTDSSGVLTRAGFEVWGSPSVWPNKPLPDIAERWGNLQSWLRYGEKAGLEGIVNTDWENSIGFFSTAELAVRLFARQMKRPPSTPLADTLQSVLAEDYGMPASKKLATDILTMGRHHVDGRNVGRYLHRPLAAWLSANEQEVSRRHIEELNDMLGDVGAIVAATKTPRGRELLEAIRLGWRFAQLYWKLRASLPDCARRIAAADAGQYVRAVRSEFEAWAVELESYRRDYEAHWAKSRYEDDPRPAAAWAAKTAQTLTEWAGALAGEVRMHPILQTPRLETRLQCRHPALPVVRITITWADGAVQTDSETMIRFESAFAAPDACSDEPSCIPLTRAEWPSEIHFETVCYGEVGIGEVAAVWGREKRVYRVSRVVGKCASVEGNRVWVGKKGATVESPLELDEKDSAWFTPDGR